MSLVVRPSPIHSVGVYTSKPIRKGARVVEYAGERITLEEADRRYDGVSRTYLYGLDDGKTVIDGHGLGAYLNHSCDPNCEVDEIKGRVWLFAIRDIAPGEELVWDYNLYDDEEPAPCSLRLPQMPRHHVLPRVDGQNAPQRSPQEETRIGSRSEQQS